MEKTIPNQEVIHASEEEFDEYFFNQPARINQG